MQYLLTEEEFKSRTPDRAAIEKEIREKYDREMAKCLAIFAANVLRNPQYFNEWSTEKTRWSALKRFAAEARFPEVTLGALPT